jgi:molybdopterin molybdotransferase
MELDPVVTPEAVRARLLTLVAPLPPRPVALAEAAGLVLAVALRAPFDLPRFTNAAMDGFAVASEDLQRPPVDLKIIGRSLAGHPFACIGLGPGEALEIATGAMLPAGADAVVPIEEVEVRDGKVQVFREVEQGAHVRRAGEDVSRGAVVLERGTVLGPLQLAAAAALGMAEVVVHPRPRLAVVPTGDEVRPPGAPLRAGEVYDAVSIPLVALVAELGATAHPHPVAPDDPGALEAALRAAARDADAIITIGGVSVGERDFVRRLGDGADIQALQVALRPARPFAFGRAFGLPLFGLPGNPAAALASFEELVRPALLVMLGKPPALRASTSAVLAEPVVQSPGRLHLVRARVWHSEGRLWARPEGRQGAGSIQSLAGANAWLVVPPEADHLPAGAEVEVRLL